MYVVNDCTDVSDAAKPFNTVPSVKKNGIGSHNSAPIVLASAACVSNGQRISMPPFAAIHAFRIALEREGPIAPGSKCISYLIALRDCSVAAPVTLLLNAIPPPQFLL